jgi:hypothetical protein
MIREGFCGNHANSLLGSGPCDLSLSYGSGCEDVRCLFQNFSSQDQITAPTAHLPLPGHCPYLIRGIYGSRMTRYVLD